MFLFCIGFSRLYTTYQRLSSTLSIIGYTDTFILMIIFHTDFKDLKDGYAIRYAVMQDGKCSRKAA
jgi:hypothetical protein